MASPSTTKKVSAASSFKKRAAPQELELPSGEVCLVKRVGMEQLLVAGVIPDSLTPMAQEAVNRGQGNKPKKTDAAKDMAANPEQIADAFLAFDKICAMVVQEPEVLWHLRETGEKDDKDKPVLESIPASERNDDIVYTDEVDLMDKMFIFQFVVGGTRDLEKFREQYGESLESLAALEGVPDPAK